ncbi:MAG: hypothetical protein E7295_09540 [Lachnospiraceae bacterium]|nr:hypothetical protein [Lachnospiraceae bacterium]
MMQLYDSMILRVRDLLSGMPMACHSYDEGKAWPENADFEILFQKDVAYELGGGRTMSANLTCVTENARLFAGSPANSAGGEETEGQAPVKEQTSAEEPMAVKDQIVVYGPDLQELQGNVSYARICEILVRGQEEKEGLEESLKSADIKREADLEREADSGRTLKLLQDLDFVKFHVYGKGFMMRTSGQSAREPVRVSKKALQDGISFERMGNTFISHYKKNPNVLAVRVSFITAEGFDYAKLSEEGRIAVEIRNSLSKIQKGLPTECSVCDIREICNEVEGLRELHFGKQEKKADARQQVLTERAKLF